MGLGIPNELSAGCTRAGFSEVAEDCDDANPDTHPGAPEQCNDVDDDCDGVVDDDPELITWYLDLDDDGFGDGDIEMESCLRPDGYASNAADCDDENKNVSPTAPELCNEIDDDCSGMADDGPHDGVCARRNRRVHDRMREHRCRVLHARVSGRVRVRAADRSLHGHSMTTATGSWTRAC